MKLYIQKMTENLVYKYSLNAVHMDRNVMEKPPIETY